MRTHIRLRHLVLAGMALFLLQALAGSGWLLQTTASQQTLDAMSMVPAPAGAASLSRFAFGVGQGGVIVRFEDGDSGTLMTSGTTKDLLDVYAAAPDFAVAAGIDTVRLWQGSSWDEIRSSTDGSIYTGVWATPEKDLALYGVINGGGFDYVCPHVPGAPTQGFCRSFGPAMLAACGHSGDIKVINQDGDIFHVDNTLADLDANAPVFAQPVPLNLTAVFVPPTECLPGPIPPQSVWAIGNYRQFWHFDGHQWTDLQVSVPLDQTLTAISGSGPGLGVAVGYKPDGNGGNLGVVWLRNLAGWSQDTSVPPATPGLLDVAAGIGADPGFVFASGFELPASGGSGLTIPGVQSRVRTVGEQGYTLVSALLQPGLACDVEVEAALLTPLPIHPNQAISFRLRVANRGGQACPVFTLVDFADSNELTRVSDDCSFTHVETAGSFVYHSVLMPGLAPGAMDNCTATFNVEANPVGQQIQYGAYAQGLDDLDPTNNHAEVSITLQ